MPPGETQEDGSQSQDTMVARLCPALLSSTAEWAEEGNPSTSWSLVFPREISDSYRDISFFCYVPVTLGNRLALKAGQLVRSTRKIKMLSGVRHV